MKTLMGIERMPSMPKFKTIKKQSDVMATTRRMERAIRHADSISVLSPSGEEMYFSTSPGLAAKRFHAFSGQSPGWRWEAKIHFQ